MFVVYSDLASVTKPVAAGGVELKRELTLCTSFTQLSGWCNLPS